MTVLDPPPSSFATTKQRDTGVGFLPEKFALALEAIAFVKAFRKQLLVEFEFAGLALTPAEARALIFLGHNEGLNQAQLAHILACQPITLVGILDRLEAADLVIRKRNELDRRVKCIYLGPRGKALVPRVEAIVSALCNHAQQGVGERHIELMRAGLSYMTGNLASPSNI
ncbi:MAG: MarR family winged helix-turn-helix transcriptional regulator [Alphaproteobacteria bacterium]|nr:MarR family winged helix-turn-helix transcriptional regulator [Alphaproteobacteria bacterium]